MTHTANRFKNSKRTLMILLITCLGFSLSACNTSHGGGDNWPSTQKERRGSH